MIRSRNLRLLSVNKFTLGPLNRSHSLKFYSQQPTQQPTQQTAQQPIQQTSQFQQPTQQQLEVNNDNSNSNNNNKQKKSSTKFTRNLVLILSLSALGLYSTDSRASIHNWLTQPLLHLLDAEDSHKLAIKLLNLGWSPKDKGTDWEGLKTYIWNKEFENPIGLAAGFDKHAEAVDGLFDLGFGFIEVGSVTPLPQVRILLKYKHFKLIFLKK